MEKKKSQIFSPLGMEDKKENKFMSTQDKMRIKWTPHSTREINKWIKLRRVKLSPIFIVFSPLWERIWCDFHINILLPIWSLQTIILSPPNKSSFLSKQRLILNTAQMFMYSNNSLQPILPWNQCFQLSSTRLVLFTITVCFSFR